MLWIPTIAAALMWAAWFCRRVYLERKRRQRIRDTFWR